MVKGIERFREYFSDCTDQYVLIGGAACDISFGESDTEFRATRDLDMVLIVEAQTKEFGQKFWQFIKEGKYRNRAKNNGEAQFYRFDKPEEPGYPSMIELFSRTDWILEQESVLTPIHIDDSVSSLSAILLNETYYQLLLEGRKVINGVSVLKPTWLIPFKAKAWLDLMKRAEIGEHVDARNIKKHRNDILRMLYELTLEQCELTDEIRMDMQEFLNKLHVTDAELKNLRIIGVHETELKETLKEIYLL